jgi:hypothetical protein
MEHLQVALRQADLRGVKKVDQGVQRRAVPDHPMGLLIDPQAKDHEKGDQREDLKVNLGRAKIVRNHHAIPNDSSSMLWNSMLMAMES